ncbi:hypothetical protein D3C72_1866190 [compost metagenome]
MSMPMLCASGTKTGASSRTAAGRSMNMPRNNIIRFISRITSHLACTFSWTQCAIPCGVWSKVNSQPIADDAMITSSTTPVARPAWTMAALSRDHVKSRYITAETRPA